MYIYNRQHMIQLIYKKYGYIYRIKEFWVFFFYFIMWLKKPDILPLTNIKLSLLSLFITNMTIS